MNYNEAKEAKNAVEQFTVIETLTKHFNKIFKRSPKVSEPYFYLFIRQDLSLAQQIVQSNHVAAVAGVSFGEPMNIANEVLIGVPNKDALHKVQDLLGNNGIEFVDWYEPDYELGLTAICSIPIREKGKRAVMAKFDLWQPPSLTGAV
jgi:hypothetical protein